MIVHFNYDLCVCFICFFPFRHHLTCFKILFVVLSFLPSLLPFPIPCGSPFLHFSSFFIHNTLYDVHSPLTLISVLSPTLGSAGTQAKLIIKHAGDYITNYTFSCHYGYNCYLSATIIHHRRSASLLLYTCRHHHPGIIVYNTLPVRHWWVKSQENLSH